MNDENDADGPAARSVTEPGRQARRIAITLPVEDRLSAAEYVDLATLAERSGYYAVLAGEVAGPEVFSLLGMIAARTTSIRIGSGIVGCYARPPALTAMAFATLASYAPGRIIAGIGTSSPVIVGSWFGMDFDRPLTTAREFIAILRRALSGEPVTYAGDRLHTDGFRATMAVPPAKPEATAEAAVPILLAAMNPAMLRLAGRAADGVFLTWTPPGEIASRLAYVRDGERRSGRPAGQVRAAASFWAYCGPRQEDALERMRRVVLQYAMVPTHRESFRQVFPRLDEATAAWHAGDRRAALSFVGDDTVRALCAIGGPETVAAHVRALWEAGVTMPIVLTPGAEPGDAAGARATITGLAQALRLAEKKGS